MKYHDISLTTGTICLISIYEKQVVDVKRRCVYFYPEIICGYSSLCQYHMWIISVKLHLKVYNHMTTTNCITTKFKVANLGLDGYTHLYSPVQPASRTAGLHKPTSPQNGHKADMLLSEKRQDKTPYRLLLNISILATKISLLFQNTVFPIIPILSGGTTLHYKYCKL